MIPMPASVAGFVRFYGGDVFDHGRISWPWYQLLLLWMPNVLASEALSNSSAVTIGAATALSPDSTKATIRQLKEEVARRR